MRTWFTIPVLPRNPLLRMLALAGAVIAVLALLALGLVVGIGVLAVAAVLLAIRRWRWRRAPAAVDPAIIEGEYTVVPPRAPARLSRPE